MSNNSNFSTETEPQIPANVSAEQAVLGSILIDNDVLGKVAAILKPSDFFRERYGWVFQSMLDLHARHEPVDFVTLQMELERQGKLADLGGPAALTNLLSVSPTSFYAEHYAKIVQEMARRRHLISVAGKIAQLAYDNEQEIGGIMDEVQAMALAAGETTIRKGLRQVRDATKRVVDKINYLASNPGELMGVPTGFVMLDRILGGFQKSDLVVLAARPGMGKCLGKGTKVLMYDGSLKAVEEVQVGDQVMGPDSKPRNVLGLARGKEMMYWVHQQFGMSYRVNRSHVLSLKRSKNERKHRNGDVVNMSVSEIVQKGPGFFSRHKGYKTAVDFPSQVLPVDPYFLGVWLGDGHSYGSRITNEDQEVIDALSVVAASRQEYVTSEPNTASNARSYRITGGKTQAARNNSMQSALGRLGVLGNKHIPEQYLINSKENRLQLLAGLVDSDGHYYRTDMQNGPFEITLKSKRLASQIKFLCDSLGYRVSFSEKWTQAQTGAGYIAFRVRFNGNVDEIPTKVLRKQAPAWRSPHNWRVSGITVEEDCIDDYYGFTIDGDHLFLLEDMTVTHNSALGFTMAHSAAKRHNKRVAIFSLEMSDEQFVQRLLSQSSGIDSHRLRTGNIHENDWTLLMEAANELSQLPLYIDDTGAVSIAHIRSECRRMAVEGGIDMIIVDYMQLMAGIPGKKNENREQEVSAISASLKALARELNVPVLALSQLSRAVESRSDKRPMLSDLRESGAIEQNSDVVMFIYREDYYNEDTDRANIADVIVAKHRHGATGTVSLFFRKELTQFRELVIERTEFE